MMPNEITNPTLSGSSGWMSGLDIIASRMVNQLQQSTAYFEVRRALYFKLNEVYQGAVLMSEARMNIVWIKS